MLNYLYEKISSIYRYLFVDEYAEVKAKLDGSKVSQRLLYDLACRWHVTSTIVKCIFVIAAILTSITIGALFSSAAIALTLTGISSIFLGWLHFETRSIEYELTLNEPTPYILNIEEQQSPNQTESFQKWNECTNTGEIFSADENAIYQDQFEQEILSKTSGSTRVEVVLSASEVLHSKIEGSKNDDSGFNDIDIFIDELQVKQQENQKKISTQTILSELQTSSPETTPPKKTLKAISELVSKVADENDVETEKSNESPISSTKEQRIKDIEDRFASLQSSLGI